MTATQENTKDARGISLRVKSTHGCLVGPRRTRRLASVLGSMIPAGSSVLDVGCGDGHVGMLLAIQKPDLSVFGAETLIRNGCAISCVQFDGRHMPVRRDAVDICMFVDVLHHVDDVRGLLKEAMRVSRRYILIKDHVLRKWTDIPVLRFMDWFGNQACGVRYGARYLTDAQWNDCLDTLSLKTLRRTANINLYPFPFDLIFGGRLHFAALLEK